MTLPDYEPRRIPEGRYQFTVIEEPEQRRHRGEKGEFISVTFKFEAKNDDGVKSHMESFLPWEERYGLLAEAFGAPQEGDRFRMSQLERITGKMFYATIRNEPDRKDPSKTWPRITEIEIPQGLEDDDIPPIKGDAEVPF